MNHSNSTDVTLNLRAPNGTSVNLIQATGGTNNDIMTVFDDLADSLINSTFVPFSMRVKPVVPLSNLPQTNQNGYWRLSITDAASPADSGRVHVWGIKFISSVGISGNNELAGRFNLSQNYPNPFNPVTSIQFEIVEDNLTELIIYNSAGQEIERPVSEYLKRGRYNITWDGFNYPSGVYFYTLISGFSTKSNKMVLIK
jgi:subtilisin-like proprotein convertase family protein